jgi:hypothetical protein
MIAYVAVRLLLALSGFYEVGWRTQMLFWMGLAFWLTVLGLPRLINVGLQHDLNIYNFLIRLNREMKAKGITLTRQESLKFDCITDGPFSVEENTLPKGPLNFLDLESAIEIYTPLYQLFLTDSDFWRACNSLQLDETVAIYTARLMGDSSFVSLVNNKHPLIPLSTLQAGYRLLLHGLAAECLHATLVQFKRQQRVNISVHN